jgi:hypothetical protein
MTSQNIPDIAPPFPNDSKTKKKCLYEENKSKIVDIICKTCKLTDLKGIHKKTCPQCSGPLEWICKCGQIRSLSNLSVHECSKVEKRKMLIEKFKQKKKIIKEVVNAECEKLQKGAQLKRIDVMKVSNILN